MEVVVTGRLVVIDSVVVKENVLNVHAAVMAVVMDRLVVINSVVVKENVLNVHAVVVPNGDGVATPTSANTVHVALTGCCLMTELVLTHLKKLLMRLNKIVMQNQDVQTG